MDKVKVELKNLETGTKPVPGSSDNIGALQVCGATNLEGFDFVAFDWLRDDESFQVHGKLKTFRECRKLNKNSSSLLKKY